MRFFTSDIFVPVHIASFAIPLYDDDEWREGVDDDVRVDVHNAPQQSAWLSKPKTVNTWEREPATGLASHAGTASNGHAPLRSLLAVNSPTQHTVCRGNITVLIKHLSNTRTQGAVRRQSISFTNGGPGPLLRQTFVSKLDRRHRQHKTPRLGERKNHPILHRLNILWQ